jgi:hypothetical protein
LARNPKVSNESFAGFATAASFFSASFGRAQL